jgi:hypothetical protein
LRERLPDDIGFANINEHPGGHVEGILYEIPDEDLVRLDESERFPDHYRRIEVQVETDSGVTTCVVYQAAPDKIADGLRPSRNYLNHILAGRDFLSEQYYEALDKSQTYSDECRCCHSHGEVIFVREGDRLFMLCQPCREARMVWGDVRGRKFTVAETEALMMHVKSGDTSYGSLAELINDAIELRLIDP